MGVDSGLPDFRGKEGLWKAYPYFKDAGMSFSDAANPDFLREITRNFGSSMDIAMSLIKIQNLIKVSKSFYN